MTEAKDAPALALRIVSAGATPEEIAAAAAVLHGALEEFAASMELDGAARVSAWQRSQRGLRTPLTPGPGVWRSFSG